MSSRFFLYNPKSHPRKKSIQEPFLAAFLLFEQLHALFKMPMPNSDRLLLSILITTGMRLD